MRTAMPVLLAAAIVLGAPIAPAVAAPQCTDLGISTRMCARPPGHTAIVSGPNPALTNPFPGWGFWSVGPVIGSGVGGRWTGY